jgi:hypothetical protein
MMLQLQLKQGKITRDQLVAHAFLLLVAGNATGEWTASLKAGCAWCKLLFTLPAMPPCGCRSICLNESSASGQSNAAAVANASRFC